MPQSRVKTIDDTVLVKTILKMRDDYGYWDLDPVVFKDTEKGFDALGNKMKQGVREVLRRVKQDGLRAHEPLKRIFEKASRLEHQELKSAHDVYEALRNVKHPREAKKPRYAF